MALSHANERAGLKVFELGSIEVGNGCGKSYLRNIFKPNRSVFIANTNALHMKYNLKSITCYKNENEY